MKIPILGLLIAMAFAQGAWAADFGKPTHNNLRYSDTYDRCTLDLWLPESDEPTPIIVLFHGGSFVAGSKEKIPYRWQAMAQVDQGVAIASVGYPFLGEQGTTDRIGKLDYFKILRVTAGAIRYLQAHAEKYNLDPDRFVVGGVSAGAMIAEYLAYAEPLGISSCLGLEQPYAVEMVMALIGSGGPPLILCTYSGTKDQVHSPVYAQRLKAHCDEVGVLCFLFGGKKNGLPTIPGNNLFPHAMTIIRAVWAGEIEVPRVEAVP